MKVIAGRLLEQAVERKNMVYTWGLAGCAFGAEVTGLRQSKMVLIGYTIKRTWLGHERSRKHGNRPSSHGHFVQNTIPTLDQVVVAWESRD